jgi:predicted transcriptional regulator
MNTTGKSNDGAVYTIRIDRQILDRLHEIAQAEHRTLAGHLRVLFERDVAEHEKQAA